MSHIINRSVMESVCIVCCSNNEQIKNEMLLKSLQGQYLQITNEEAKEMQLDICELSLELEIYEKGFSSAAAAYNYAIEHSSSDYFFFVHQDVAFLDSLFLLKAVNTINKHKNALFGLCGSKINGNLYTYSNIWHGLWNNNIGTPIDDIVEVQGLDEVMVAFHKDVTKKIRFDEKTFDGWHLYVEDICLQAELLSIKVYVLPYKSQHKSFLEMPGYMKKYGILPKEYFTYLVRIRNKYKGKVDSIVCPCCCIRTDFIHFWRQIFLMYKYHRTKEKWRIRSL